MKRPTNLLYSVDETPPIPIVLLAAVQHFAVLLYSAFPIVIVARAAEATADQAINMISIGLLLIGLGTVAQAYRFGGVFGSGYLLPNGFYVSYLSPYLAAAKIGGLPLVFGLTVISGLMQALFAPFIRRLQAFLPPEISGLVVLLTGLLVADVGLQFLLGQPTSSGATAAAPSSSWLIAIATLASIVFFNVWARGTLQMICVLLGMLVGNGVAHWVEPQTTIDLMEALSAPVFAPPTLSMPRLSFDWGLAVSFVLLGLYSVLHTGGNITALQKHNDAEWVRPDLGSISRGTFTAGGIQMLSGLAGTLAVGNLTSNVGVSAATGITSRVVALGIAAIAILAALFPRFSAVLISVPTPVIAGAMIFFGSTIIVSGVQITTARMFDSRRTIVIGLSMIVAIAVISYPSLQILMPPSLLPLVSSPLVAATLTGLLLTAIFRLGIRKRVHLIAKPGDNVSELTYDFITSNGAAWGARPDVVSRTAFGTTQLVETILENCEPTAPVRVMARFDEFNLDVTAEYEGKPLELPDRRPSNSEIRDTDTGAQRLAGFLLRRNADRVEANTIKGTSTIVMHFDH